MSQKFTNEKVKDSSSKIIFKDPILCAQFLRGYVDIPILKSVKPEGIEDVSERFVHMFAEERNSDVVKKVYIEMNETPFFLVSLIEHKSDVDYNVVMQILRYMVFIWEDYEKEMERQHRGISKSKSFKYPPILPVIFYDGADNWTAAAELHERILFSDMFAKYIPDYLLSIIAQVVEILLVKLNVPIEESEAFTRRIKERKMGELLAHFQGWDVQAIRKESREEGIEKLVKAMNVVIDSKETAMRQLVAQYELSEEEAAEKVEMYWQS
ncbi:MAG: Rpn family recombination-promoting nuclease/putative transposase [Lachnospiraceae bacterium]|nr:Rpn family recombination-promoting nuclease/putative transposase [Lachnospiraceae bacterium]